MTYIPRVGLVIGKNAFDLSNLYSRREVNHLFLLILTIIFRPGIGILIIFVRKCQNPHPMPDLLLHPSSGLTLIGALHIVTPGPAVINICHALWIVVLQMNDWKAKLGQLPDLFLDYAVEGRNHSNARSLV